MPNAECSSYVFILNPAAGAGRDAGRMSALLDGLCRDRGLDASIRMTEAPGHGRVLAEEAVRKGFRRIVAVGGDGTIHEVAQGVMGSGSALGIIPRGSGNGFAREFGIPTDPRKACETLLASRPLAIDAGKINGEPFFNVAGFGFDAQISRAFDRSQKGGRRGAIPYFLCGFREFWSYVPPRGTLRFEGRELAIAPFLVAFANCRQYGTGAVIAPGALADDGLLQMVLVKPVSWPRLLWHLPRVFLGTIDRAPVVETFPVREARIDLEGDAPYHVDGEIRPATRRLEVSVTPRCLNLLVPPGYRSSGN
jgi:diacylglycerol kinase (ATP)